MIANLVLAEHPSWIGDAQIWRVDPPYRGHEYLAVTVHPVEYSQWRNAGVDVVGCTANGGIPGATVDPIYQSYVVSTHAEVLTDLGYEIGDPVTAEGNE
ncbi:hypothetical protein [Nocardia brasiliensis]|uniref:hypothetical protein n=1 Tax=Nocardia brasiliensis TaxID=37326 RepID=UPI0004A7354E|nr:hypothetical protein [Nocardia brasiliensis]